MQSLETQSQGSLEPPASGLVHDLAESCVAGSVDIHIRVAGKGWFITLNVSMRNCTIFDSVTWNDLLRFPSIRARIGPRITNWPRVPRFPGKGFCNRICPVFASATA